MSKRDTDELIDELAYIARNNPELSRYEVDILSESVARLVQQSAALASAKRDIDRIISSSDNVGLTSDPC